MVIYSHQYSRRVITVCSARGKNLFQLWHDGVISSAHWLSSSKLLVLAGLNDEVPWHGRGDTAEARKFRPWVVWAIRPYVDSPGNRYVCTGQSSDCVEPAWYKCVGPPESSDVFANATVREPPIAKFNDGTNFLLKFTYDFPVPTGHTAPEAGWIVSGQGLERATEPYENTAYLERKTKIAKIEDFSLSNLPKIQADTPTGAN